MKRPLILFFIGFGLVASILYFGIDHLLDRKINTEAMVPIKDIALDIVVDSMDGERIDIGQLKDKVVLLNFWASWCPPCLKEFPAFVRLLKKLPKEVILIAISSDRDSRKAIDFLKAQGIEAPNLKVVLDPEGIWSKTLNIQKLPETYIVKNGRILGKSEGYSQWDSPYWVQKLSSLF